MITDFDDFCTWMFVIVDDLWQGIAPLYRRSGPDPTSCSDSELITVAIISECRTWSRETVAMQEWVAYRHLFPRLPERSRYGMALSASGWDMYGLVRSNGGELSDERSGKLIPTLDDPRVVETVRFFAEVGRDQLGTLPPLQPRQSDHPVALFGQRKVALFFSGPWDIARLKQEAQPDVFAEVGTALLSVARPGAPNASVQGGGGLFVPKGAAHREAAFEFMKWVVSDRYALRIAKEMGRYPVRTALYDDRYFKSEPLLAPFLEQLKNARPYRLEAYADIHRIWENAIRASFSPSADVAAILDDAEQRAQRLDGAGQ